MAKRSQKGAAAAYGDATKDFCREYTNPITGQTFELRKPPAQPWFLANQLPQDLMRRAGDEKKSTEQSIAEVTEALRCEEAGGERDELTDYSLRLMEYGCVVPQFKRKLQEGDDPADYLTLPEGGGIHFLDEDWTFVMGILSGTSDNEVIPMNDGGTLTRGELADFPDSAGYGAYDRFGRRVSEVRNPPERPDRYQSFSPPSRG